MKTFREIKSQKELDEAHVFVSFTPMNEGFFDKLLGFFNRIANMFKDPAKLSSAVSQASTELGDKATKVKYDPKMTKVGETVFIRMKDPKNEKNVTDWSLSKLADLQDGTGIFQITGSNNAAMLKSLTGSEKQEDLAKNSVMALVSNQGVETGKPMDIKIVKNILPGGQDYKSQTIVDSILPGTSVEKAMTSAAPAAPAGTPAA